MHSYGTQKQLQNLVPGPVTPDVARPRIFPFKPLPDPPSPPEGEFVDEILAVTTQAYRVKARTSQTRQAYHSDMQHFTKWCDENRFTALPASPETVAFYLAAFGDQTPGAGGLAIATLERRLVGIAHAHKAYYSNMPE
ncbi:MAG: hypothetical protein EOO40_11250, partial [Deltaproteobacteria bacterium]